MIFMRNAFTSLPQNKSGPPFSPKAKAGTAFTVSVAVFLKRFDAWCV